MSRPAGTRSIKNEHSLNHGRSDYGHLRERMRFVRSASCQSENMASYVPSRHWRLRDVPLAVVLLVWAAFAASVLFYFSDRPPFRHEVAMTSQKSRMNSPMPISSREIDDDSLYSGSILVVPERGERCWEFGLDNRTGKMWDKGYVNCYEAVSRPGAEKTSAGMSAERLRAISKTFHLGGD